MNPWDVACGPVVGQRAEVAADIGHRQGPCSAAARTPANAARARAGSMWWSAGRGRRGACPSPSSMVIHEY
ncbi:hypothetical protein ACWDLG_40615, partial [Nonomuraea sp. NPDC003727]